MKLSTYVLAILFFTCTNIFAQSDSACITGIVKEVKPHFGGQQTLVVNGTELVLISDPKDATGNTFEVNSAFRDILVKKDNAFGLNPKYKGRILKFTYTMNGKGWKCIATINELKVKKNGTSSPAATKR